MSKERGPLARLTNDPTATDADALRVLATSSIAQTLHQLSHAVEGLNHGVGDRVQIAYELRQLVHRLDYPDELPASFICSKCGGTDWEYCEPEAVVVFDVLRWHETGGGWEADIRGEDTPHDGDPQLAYMRCGHHECQQGYRVPEWVTFHGD